MARPGIVILGKARGRKKESLQFFARVSVASLLWHAASEPRPIIIVVTRDAPEGVPDAHRAKGRLVALGIPEESVVARSWSNCTLLEARAVRVLVRAHDLGELTVLTHPYHRRRAQRFFDEVVPSARVVAVEPGFVEKLPASPRRDEASAHVARSMPTGVDLRREQVVEAMLSALHEVDPRGRVERWLAGRVRPLASVRPG